MHSFLGELGYSFSTPLLLFVDHQSTMQVVCHPEHHGPMKHLFQGNEESHRCVQSILVKLKGYRATPAHDPTDFRIIVGFTGSTFAQVNLIQDSVSLFDMRLLVITVPGFVHLVVAPAQQLCGWWRSGFQEGTPKLGVGGARRACTVCCTTILPHVLQAVVEPMALVTVSLGACGSMDSAWTGAPAARIVYFRSPVARDLCPSI
jgi:hypothetical protein